MIQNIHLNTLRAQMELERNVRLANAAGHKTYRYMGNAWSELFSVMSYSW